MQPLEKNLRNDFAKTIQKARELAEDAARASLDELGVAETSAFSHQSDRQKELRTKLQLHGQQLGDVRSENGAQELDRLVEEVAYEHWHRMLFARFLAENNLLMYPDPVSPVPVSLEECNDLAPNEGAANGWELASRYAARMLPQIFRPDSPVFALELPPEFQQKLERLVSDLPLEVFTSSDSLGWAYQFWQTKRKKEINDSEAKIGARELPAVTQLFTEPYMVHFLLDNSLGAWWAARRLGAEDFRNASTEDELRLKASLPGVPLEYLRFVKDENSLWCPAAGSFDKWPAHLSELKVLDPCCGSGHFLVAALQMLVPLRMEMEGLSAREAVDKVLSENIHGLEIDRRCVELAAFAIALTAWKYSGSGGYRALPELNFACSGLALTVKREEWERLAFGDHNMKIALDWMYDVFKDAPILGSLIDPSKTQAAGIVPWEGLSAVLAQAFNQEKSFEYDETAVVAQGLSKASTLLAEKYSLIMTNVPYLARGSHNDVLRGFCETNYSEGKGNLATVFLDRCLNFCKDNGTTTIVLPQNWLFNQNYRKFREKLICSQTWHLIALLGTKGFTTPMWDLNVQLLTLSKGNCDNDNSGFFVNEKIDTLIRGIDVSKVLIPEGKARRLLAGEIKSVKQLKQLENPDARVMLIESLPIKRMDIYCSFFNGMQTGDYSRYGKYFWEMLSIHGDWIFYQSTIARTSLFSGREGILYWQKGKGDIAESASSIIRGIEAWNNKGISISATGNLYASLYTGSFYDENTVSLIAKDPELLPAMWSFCSSSEYYLEVRKINQALKVRGDLVKVPFNLDYWTKVAAEKYPKGLPKPYTDDPTQWIFHGHPCGSVVWDETTKMTEDGEFRTDSTVLQIVVARLLGYRWPAELDSDMELADEQRAWVKNCEDLLSFADKDGIVCIPSVSGEKSAADRLLDLIIAAFGTGWNHDTLSTLLAKSDHVGKTLDTWLRDKFFVQHCKLFQNRPFIWQIWDGLRGGFSALVNYHKLNYKNLETLTYTYLGDWIARQKRDIANAVDGAREKLDAAENLKKRLELILKGESPYDIFVRWKPLGQQPIGWNPDLNDGVRLNIRPFITAEVLRFNKKPQINVAWEKDRGKDVASAPWYAVFGGERINDHHLTLEEKQKAKERK